MNSEIHLQSRAARLLFFLGVLGVCGWLGWVIVNQFIVATLTDERIAVDRERLAPTAQAFPDSPRLNARYARLELLSIDRNLEAAYRHAARAVQLSPYNYEYRLLLGSIEELQGDRAAAEQSLRKAVELAPANPETHWQLANVLLRQKKLEESLPSFQRATATRRNFLPATLDLLWRASGGNIAAVEAVTNRDAESQMALARFLLGKSQINDAVRVFATIDRDTRLADPASGALLDSLIGASTSAAASPSSLSVARQLWVGLVSKPADDQTALVWNGGFEADVLKNFAQFDWNLTANPYARLSFDSGAAHSGARALKIEFVGKDTTRLDNEIRQTLALAPGVKYRLEYWVKTDKYAAPEGLRVVISENKTNVVVARSEPLPSGTADWQRLMLEFVAPPSSAAGLVLSVKRLPQFSYDEPTRGIVWFDDFSIRRM